MEDKENKTTPNKTKKKNTVAKKITNIFIRPLKSKKDIPIEERDDLKDIYYYTIIVNKGQGNRILKMLKQSHTSFQLMKNGESSVMLKTKGIVGIQEADREIIRALVRAEYVPAIKSMMDEYFTRPKNQGGFAFTIKLSSIVGAKVYKFVTQTVRG